AIIQQRSLEAAGGPTVNLVKTCCRSVVRCPARLRRRARALGRRVFGADPRAEPLVQSWRLPTSLLQLARLRRAQRGPQHRQLHSGRERRIQAPLLLGAAATPLRRSIALANAPIRVP